MPIELILNPQASGYEKLQADLRTQFAKYTNLGYSEVKQPPPPGVLSAEHEIVKFVFQHPEVLIVGAKLATELIKLATLIIQTVRAVAERHEIHSDPKNPTAVLIVENRTLILLSSPQKEQKFLRALKDAGEREAAKQSAAEKKELPIRHGRSK